MPESAKKGGRMISRVKTAEKPCFVVWSGGKILCRCVPQNGNNGSITTIAAAVDPVREKGREDILPPL